MNNLTPLQEVASRIYAAKIASYTAILHNNPNVKSINYSLAMEDSIDKAKSLLEACKPEPLEWLGRYDESYSQGGEFSIIIGDYAPLEYVMHNLQNTKSVYTNTDLSELKNLAEHIRTR